MPVCPSADATTSFLLWCLFFFLPAGQVYKQNMLISEWKGTLMSSDKFDGCLRADIPFSVSFSPQSSRFLISVFSQKL